MRYITVTTRRDGTPLRINVDAIEAWEPGPRAGAVVRFAGQSVDVVETSEEVDRLVAAEQRA